MKHYFLGACMLLSIARPCYAFENSSVIFQGLSLFDTAAEPEDPLGDTFGSPNTAHDISNFEAVISPTLVTFVVDFYDPIAAPSVFSPNSVVGFIDIDLDQNASTGAIAKKSEFSPSGDSGLSASAQRSRSSSPPSGPSG